MLLRVATGPKQKSASRLLAVLEVPLLRETSSAASAERRDSYQLTVNSLLTWLWLEVP